MSPYKNDFKHYFHPQTQSQGCAPRHFYLSNYSEDFSLTKSVNKVITHQFGISGPLETSAV